MWEDLLRTMACESLLSDPVLVAWLLEQSLDTDIPETPQRCPASAYRSSVVYPGPVGL